MNPNLKLFMKEILIYTAIILGFYFLYFKQAENDKPKSKVPFVYQQF